MSKINQNQNLLQSQIDSTSHIYRQTGKDVPLTVELLSFKYISTPRKLEKSGSSGKISTEIAKDNSRNKTEITFQYTDYVLLIIISMFSLLAYVRISGKKYISRLIFSVQNYSYSVSFFRERNMAFILNGNILLLVFFIGFAMTADVLIDYFGLNGPPIGKWAQLFVYVIVILGFVVLYKLVYRLLGVLFGQYKIVSEYLFYFSNLLKILGIIYVILLFGSYFTSSGTKFIFIYLALIATIVGHLIKILRIFMIFFRNRFPLYYMILYFCALEIVPLLLFFKIFLALSGNAYSFSNILD